jgi:OmcA/MtrC family decaheme c-type cytochrome
VASLRTLSATITAAAVSATDGSVTVSFKLADSASGSVDYAPGGVPTIGVVPVTQGFSPAGLPFKGLNFTLAKLMPSSNGASTYWKSYTGKCNVNNASPNPDMVGSTAYHNILQGYSEIEYGQVTAAQNLATNSAGKPAMAPGILTSLGSGNWTYKFALVNASTHNADGSGDIRTISTAINLNTAAPLLSVGGAANPAAAYNWNAVPTCPDDGVTGIAAGTTSAAYNANLTHRIGMIFTTNPATGTAVDNVNNATFDFVPSGAKAETRNIVTMANCATCHAGRKIHKGYATELCVTCHNQNTSDPSAASASTTVDLKYIVHKLHYKGTAQWVHGETFGTGNMVGFPGNVMKCQVCHDENATKPGTSTKLENAANWYTTPTAEACGTCHDDTVATAHIQNTGTTGFGTPGAVEMCTVCHGAGSADGLDAKMVHGKLLP